VGALTAVFWVPTLHAVLRGQATQGHYLSPELLSVRVGVGEPAALAVLAVVSVSAFCVTFGRSATRAVAVLLLALVLYQLASAAALVLVHQQFQPHRAVTMLWASFGAAVPVALDGLRGREPFGRFAIVAALIAAAAAFALGAAQGADLASGPLAVSAHTPPHLDRADAMSRAITQAAHRRPADLTVLVGFYPKRRVRRFVQPPRNPADAPHVMMVTEPYNGFLPLRARYAHPEARLASRIGVVQAAAACRSAACTTRRLARSPFGPIDAVVLLRAHGRYVLYAQEDAFPAPRLVLISFRRSAFATATWVRRDLGRLSAFVRSPRAA
jgi:hypothetical protein